MENLIEEAKEGNKEAYTELILSVKDELNNIARKKIKNQEDVNDILQNTFIIGYLKIKQLKSAKYFKTWIIRILINECNKYYREKERYMSLIEKCNNYYENDNYIDINIGFDDLIKELDTIEKKIFRMYYQENFSMKTIAEKLNIKENTIKTKIYRGKRKIYEKYKKFVLFVLIIGILMTGVTFGKDIISYLKNIFSLSSLGQNNEGVLNAIENKQWIQNVDMDLINLDNEYGINVKYIIVDEINIYILFELENKQGNNIEFDRISITDLKLTDNNSNLIYDIGVADEQLYGKISGWKKIENDENNKILELLYIFSEGFPNIKTLKFDFSRVVLYNDKNPSYNKTIYMDNKNFSIEINEKFISQNKKDIKLEIKKNRDNMIVKKAVITETGFYAVIKTNNHNVKLKLSSEKFSKICEKQLLYVEPEKNEFTFLIYSIIDENKNVIGTIITPGIGVALEALNNSAAQLSDISLEPKCELIGRDTRSSICSGIINGNIYMIDGFIRNIKEELGLKNSEKKLGLIATGGAANLIVPFTRNKFAYYSNLTLLGEALLYQKNRKKP